MVVAGLFPRVHGGAIYLSVYVCMMRLVALESD
jgi:hypothetical protein